MPLCYPKRKGKIQMDKKKINKDYEEALEMLNQEDYYNTQEVPVDMFRIRPRYQRTLGSYGGT